MSGHLYILAAFSPGEMGPDIHLIGDSFDTRADLDKMAKKKVPDPARN
jgi:hypothetical protein